MNVTTQFVVVSDSAAIVGQEGREGEAQPQLEFSPLCPAASLAVPRSETVRRFWAGRAWGAVASPRLLSPRVNFTICQITAGLGCASKRDRELLRAGERQRAPAEQGSAGNGERVTLVLYSILDHDPTCTQVSMDFFLPDPFRPEESPSQNPIYVRCPLLLL